MRIGELAPDFEATNQFGDPVRFSDVLLSGPVVLFFFPKAMTPGWTKESCRFRDLSEEFAKVGASVVGISADPWDQLLVFDEANHLGLVLLSDPERSVASQFGVKRMGRLPNKRRTFVVAPDRRVVAMITSESNMGKHADGALAKLRELR